MRLEYQVRIQDNQANVEVRQRTGVVRKLSDRVDQSVLRWYGHMVRMDEERLTKKVWRAPVTGERRRGRPNLRWMDGPRGRWRCEALMWSMEERWRGIEMSGSDW